MKVSISEIQGNSVLSPYGGQTVTTHGVVTGHSRKGFFVQMPDNVDAPTGVSRGVFVFSPREKLLVGHFVEVSGKVSDYIAKDNDKPTTQIRFAEGRELFRAKDPVEPIALDVDRLGGDLEIARLYLNSLEGMMVMLERGATFVAPSNPFGDYVVVPPSWPGVRTEHGGVLVNADAPERWLPSFRVLDYDAAPVVDVGAALLSHVVGPLNYRAGAYQIVATGPVKSAPAKVRTAAKTSLSETSDHLTVMTVNSFNLDPHVERVSHVKDRDMDVDDDLGDQQFLGLAEGIVNAGQCPDVVALQEIQDNDGAEQTAVVSATRTFQELARQIRQLSGCSYEWIDCPPIVGEDGGQPGGNIRNGYLYRADRVEWVDGRVTRLGETDSAYDGSRKPVVATFRLRSGGKPVVAVNVHLASKRNQHSIFAPEQPGHDPREVQRVAQCALIARALSQWAEQGQDYYVTGDFNDFEFSRSLRALLADHSVNLVDTLAHEHRYDYNHRGQLQVLMHGIVAKRQLAEKRVDYEILHGNELTGVRPGSAGDKASDHAYVIARLKVN